MASPQWPHMALIITFDEHGGFYDHVAPPPACRPDDIAPIARPRRPARQVRRYGVRVPLIVVSPYAKAHYVSHDVYDHTSILRLHRDALPSAGADQPRRQRRSAARPVRLQEAAFADAAVAADGDGQPGQARPSACRSIRSPTWARPISAPSDAPACAAFAAARRAAAVAAALATRGRGAKSAPHAHHGIHVVLCVDGELRLREGRSWRRVAGVLTAPDVPHAIDGSDATVLLVFLDPESDAGQALHAATGGPTRASRRAADVLVAGADPMTIMQAAAPPGPAAPSRPWAARRRPRARRVHPRVRRLLAALRALPVGGDASLDALAESVGLSPGRLMHAFTESIGLPLRPYLAWLKLQRAAAAIAGGAALSDAAAAAGSPTPPT